MTYPTGSSRKNNKARLFPDIRVLAYQEPDKIQKIQKLGAVSIEF